MIRYVENGDIDPLEQRLQDKDKALRPQFLAPR